jgi:hypothetical protein
MTEQERARRLAEWLASPVGTPPPEGIDDDTIGAVYALRPDRAPRARLTIDDILSTVRDGPFAPAEADEATEMAEPAEVRSPGLSEREDDPVSNVLPFPGAVRYSESEAPAPVARRSPWWRSPVFGVALAAAAAAAFVVPRMGGLRAPSEALRAEESARDVAPAGAPSAEETPATIPEAAALVPETGVPAASLPPISGGAIGGSGGYGLGGGGASRGGAASNPPPNGAVDGRMSAPGSAAPSGAAPLAAEERVADAESPSAAPTASAKSAPMREEAPYGPSTSQLAAQDAATAAPGFDGSAEGSAAPGFDGSAEGSAAPGPLAGGAAPERKKQEAASSRRATSAASGAPSSADAVRADAARGRAIPGYDANAWQGQSDVAPVWRAALAETDAVRAAAAFGALATDARVWLAQDASTRQCEALVRAGRASSALQAADAGLSRSTAGGPYRARLLFARARALDALGRSDADAAWLAAASAGGW